MTFRADMTDTQQLIKSGDTLNSTHEN